MESLGSIALETKRLLLRTFKVDDALDMYKNWASDNDVTKYLTWPSHPNVNATRNLLNIWEEHAKDKNEYQWCIELKERKEAIGSISVVHIDNRTESVEIGYCIGKEFWNQGLMTEALQRVIDFFFQEVHAKRISARHDVNNPASGKVMKKCGMEFEGIHRKADKNNQGICDVAIYALLKEDYDNVKNSR